MEKQISMLLWENHDGFWKALTQIAKEETQREVISTELKEWWGSLRDVTERFPFNALPNDI